MITMRWRLGALIVTAALAAGGAAAADWSNVPGPSAGPAQAIGGHANGCLAGAVALAPEGPGWQVIRLSRQRFWGHPELIAYLEALGARAAAAGLPPLVIGDMAQPRGGRMSFGHSSHQSGLDVDIWFRLDLGALPREARETLEHGTMVDHERRVVDPAVWEPRHAQMLWLAAQDPRVARIFVNPAIKQAICALPWPDRDWLRLVRPWHGHDGHFHVRLLCPPGQPLCVDQEPPPPGDGCGTDLLAWFRPPEPAPKPAEPAPPRQRPAPPPECAALLAR